MKSLTERQRILAGLTAEVAFAILPLLVVSGVLLYAQHVSHLFSAPEWSFGAAILFGQALVKFISGLARGGKAAIGPVQLIVALLTVFGLVPSLMILTMTLLSFEAMVEPAGWLKVLQVVFFFGAAAMYLLLGVIGETWSKGNN